MELLPTEINCQTFSYITDPTIIQQLVLVNKEYQDFIYQCVTTLAWDPQLPVNISYVRPEYLQNFPNLRSVQVPVYLDPRSLSIDISPKLRFLHLATRYLSGISNDNILQLILYILSQNPGINVVLRFVDDAQSFFEINDNVMMFDLEPITLQLDDTMAAILSIRDNIDLISPLDITSSQHEYLMQKPRLKRILYHLEEETLYYSMNMLSYGHFDTIIYPEHLWYHEIVLRVHQEIMDSEFDNLADPIINKNYVIELPFDLSTYQDIDMLLRKFPTVTTLGVFVDDPERDQVMINNLMLRYNIQNFLIYTISPENLTDFFRKFTIRQILP